MELWQSIVLGVVEGLTEYLPVSSTGHLILSQRAMNLPASPAANAYAICIQAGAILAVLSLYWKSVRQVLTGWLGKVGVGKGDEAGFVLGRNIVVAFLPAAFFGLLLDDWIEAKLFGLWPIVGAWFVGGVAILVVALRRRKRATESDSQSGASLATLTWKLALTIGLIQCLAMWPGTSRSLVTIVGGVLVGLSLTAAVEFSFLLGVVTLCAATVYKAKDAGPLMIAEYGWLPMIIGSLAAWISAVVAVKWMVSYLQNHGMSVFGYYRIALAVSVAVAIVAGVLAV